MALKKQNFNDDEEVAIFDEAVVYKRGEYWHFRLWLNDERKYARKSLRTRSRTTAIAGHANMSTTQRYIDMRPSVIRAAVELV